MEKDEKVKKNGFLKATVLFLFLVLLVLLSGLAYAKFVTSGNGTATATVAEFNFNLKNLQGDVSTASNPVDFPITRTDGNQKVQTGMIAPDTYGRFDMIIDSTGTQVSYRYDIEVTVTNCPTNLIFYTDKDHQNPISPVARTGTGTEQDPKIATFTISKFVPVSRANEIHKEIVYWAWPYETGNTANEIHTNDLLDSADMEKMVTMAITVTGTQVTGQPAGVPMVGEQTTSVKDIVDIDLPAPGGQKAATITNGQQLNVTLTYDNPPANIETVAVVSSDSSIVTGTFNTTTNKVVLNALKNGTATITLRGEQSWDLIGTVDVTVQSRVNELSLSSDNSTVSVERNTTQNVTITDFAGISPIEQFTITSSDSSLATATYDNNGTITITAGANPGTATITLTGSSSGTTKTIAVKVPLVIGDTVSYSTTLNGVTLDEWSVFYKETKNGVEYTYIILDDYLPRAAISSTLRTNYNLADGDGTTYTIKSTTNRTDLINAMATTSNWSELINNGSVNGTALSSEVKNDTNVIAMGSPDIELWANSWNSESNGFSITITLTQNEMGYLVNGSYLMDIPSVDMSKVNYSLYIPHTSIEDSCYGYWLASPNAQDSKYVWCVVYYGRVGAGSYYGTSLDFRPVICLPSSILE